MQTFEKLTLYGGYSILFIRRLKIYRDQLFTSLIGDSMEDFLEGIAPLWHW